jgi:SAM-dependent methyltransferase
MSQDSTVVCVVCGGPAGEPVYASDRECSITSLCEVVPSPTVVRFCQACGHVQTTEMPGIEAYYDTQYKILIESEEEDQLYAMSNGQKVYRLDHQARTLLRKLTPSAAARILDYGSAKGGTLKRLLAERGDLRVHLFDVSAMYLPFWKAFLDEGRWATYRPPAAWRGTFDIITSFFSLEHVARPREMMAEIASLLKPGGTLYGIVPNTFTNIADFVVIDHVNHFSAASLAFLLRASGFGNIDIDEHAHTSAFVVTATAAVQQGTVAGIPRSEIARLGSEVERIAAYWRNFSSCVREFEDGRTGRPAAIYGSGFYGTFIASCLSRPLDIRCFVDQNPFRQGRRLLDRPIIAPEALPEEIGTVYVGLNPVLARAEIAKVACWSGRRLDHFLP